jgi:hypothetical protein
MLLVRVQPPDLPAGKWGLFRHTRRHRMVGFPAMAGEDHRDPAEIHRERRRVVDRELNLAQFAQAKADQHGGPTSDLGAKCLAAASNHRLRALCIHAGIEPIDGKDQEP